MVLKLQTSNGPAESTYHHPVYADLMAGLDVHGVQPHHDADIWLNLQRSFNDEAYAPHFPLLEHRCGRRKAGKKPARGFTTGHRDRLKKRTLTGFETNIKYSKAKDLDMSQPNITPWGAIADAADGEPESPAAPSVSQADITGPTPTMMQQITPEMVAAGYQPACRAKPSSCWR